MICMVLICPKLTYILCDMFRYLVDVRWLKQWKLYVGFGISNQQQIGSQNAHPGSVDNSCLFQSMYVASYVCIRKARKFDEYLF